MGSIKQTKTKIRKRATVKRNGKKRGRKSWF